MHCDADLQPVLHPAIVAVSGKSGNDPIRIDPADAVVIPVGKIKISLGVEDHPVRTLDLRLTCRSAVSAESGPAPAGDESDHPLTVDLAYSG